MFLHLLFDIKAISGDFKGFLLLLIFISYVCFAGELIYRGPHTILLEVIPNGYVLKACWRQGFEINSLLSHSDAI